jgi:hypothetical protein
VHCFSGHAGFLPTYYNFAKQCQAWKELSFHSFQMLSPNLLLFEKQNKEHKPVLRDRKRKLLACSIAIL